MADKWFFASSEENWECSESYPTREAAISAGTREYEGGAFYVGRGELVTVREVAERMASRVCDYANDGDLQADMEIDSEYELLDAIESDDEAELTDLIATWLAKCSALQTYFRIENIERVKELPR